MLETSARLLRLLTLLQAHRDWSGPDLAARLEVTTRTVRRDVDKLRSLGYPVHASTGTAGGYQLGAGADLPPLLLDDEEAVAVVVGLRTAALGAVAGLGESSVRALATIEQVFPARLRQRVAAFEHALVAVPSGAAPVEAATITAIAAACRDHEGLRLDYRAHDGARSTRSVEPYRLVVTGRRWYLLAFDLDRADWRTLRVDRLSLRTQGGRRFTPRPLPAEDVSSWTTLGLSTRAYRYQGRFTVHAPAAAVADVVTPASGVVEALTATTCTLLTGSNSLDALAVHVVTLGFEVDVHGPPELVAHLAVVAERLTAAVERGRIEDRTGPDRNRS